jgi:hypothetical protein
MRLGPAPLSSGPPTLSFGRAVDELEDAAVSFARAVQSSRTAIVELVLFEESSRARP